MRCGDSVRHKATDETWTVAYVDGERLSWVGWPAGEAKVSDCVLVNECSDEEHVALLKRIEQAQCEPYDRRPVMARRALEQIAAAARDDNFDKLAVECEASQAECSRLYSMWGAETDRLKRLEALKRLAWLEVIDKKILDKGIAA